MLGLGFGAGAGGKAKAGRRFSPADLFAGGELGMWLDPSDMSTLFQDMNGNLPAAIGMPVGRINDKSGGGWNIIQGTSSARPILQQDAGGRLYLQFDGVNDRMFSPTFALGSGWDRVSAIRQTNWLNGRRLFGGGGTAGILQQTSANPTLGLFDGSIAAANAQAPLGTAAVIFERHAGASSLLAVNNGAPVSGNPGSNQATSVSLGADPAGTSAAAFHFYGFCLVKPTLSEAQLGALRSFYAAKAGVAL